MRRSGGEVGRTLLTGSSKLMVWAAPQDLRELASYELVVVVLYHGSSGRVPSGGATRRVVLASESSYAVAAICLLVLAGGPT